ncbi:MAG: aminodeoxychorismate synthase component [Haloplasmataceae bacterium]|jgi:hypothetical protein|nr:aminodeoxychorismate synthase component [Haloplasmataceae bacterium]
MKKKVYYYELDKELLPNFLEKIKIICNNYSNYMIVHQDVEKYNYTYIGLNPKEYIYTQEKALNIVNKTQFLTKKDDYLRHIIEWLNRNEIIAEVELPPFFGGAMGFINDSLDDYYKNKSNLSDIPELCFMIFDDLVIVDHKKNKIIFTYIGDLNNEEYYYNKYRQFILLIENTNLQKKEISYSSLKFNEDEIIEKFNKIATKFNEDKYFIIKNAEKVILDSKLDPIEIFFRFVNANKYSICSYFKTSDFSLMVNSNQNDFTFINSNFSLTYNNNNLKILDDITRDQVYKLIEDVIICQSDPILKFEGKSKSKIYEILYNFMLLNSNYGIPFDRIHAYIRRTESEYRLNGLIGLLGYNNNVIASQIIEPIIFDRKEHYLNIETYHSHLTLATKYINEVIFKVNQYLDLLDN